MKRFIIPLTSTLLVLSGFFLGCATSSHHNEFVRSINFTPLDSFAYKHTLVTGMDWRDSEKQILEKLSEQVLRDELFKRGFEEVDGRPDFYVVAKWKKAVSSYPGLFDSIDGPTESINDRHNPSSRYAVRYTLTIEIYESKTLELFWRKELPNIFDALQFTEERATNSLRRAIKGFPNRIEKDPNLPNIQ